MTHQSMAPLRDALWQSQAFVISSSLLPTQSALPWPRASLAPQQPYLTSPNALELPIPTTLSSLTRYYLPAALPLMRLSYDYKVFWAKMICYYVLVQCPEKWSSDLKALL